VNDIEATRQKLQSVNDELHRRMKVHATARDETVKGTAPWSLHHRTARRLDRIMESIRSLIKLSAKMERKDE
jgi:hypothetical protein